MEIPNNIEQICLLGFGSNINHPTLAGGKVIMVSEFISEIIEKISETSISSSAVSENHSLLRTLQFITQNRKMFSELLGRL